MNAPSELMDNKNNTQIKVTVLKRDGTVMDYDIHKIVEACRKAAMSAGYSNCYDIAFKVAAAVDTVLREINNHLTVPFIHRLVEDELMKTYPDIARKYIEFRHDRELVRINGSDLYKKLTGLIDKTDTSVTTENANKDANVFPVMRDLMAGVVSKQFASNFISKRVLQAHEQGWIHWHDLDYSPFLPFTNCCLVDLKGMLSNGFRLGNAGIEPPKSIGVACAVTAQIIAQVASHQYGGTTIANIDQVLAPYVEKSYQKNLELAKEYNITDQHRFALERATKETYDGIQALEYEINTLFSSNGQQPFVTFSFGMGTSWQERAVQSSILNNDGETIMFISPFEQKAIDPDNIANVGLNDKRGSADSNYITYLLTDVAKFLSTLIYILTVFLSILLFGYISFIWLLILLARRGFFFLDDLLEKISLGKLDPHAPLGKLIGSTIVSFFILAFSVSGYISSLFILIYTAILMAIDKI